MMKLSVVNVICIVLFMLSFLWKDVFDDYVISTMVGTGSSE